MQKQIPLEFMFPERNMGWMPHEQRESAAGSPSPAALLQCGREEAGPSEECVVAAPAGRPKETI